MIKTKKNKINPLSIWLSSVFLAFFVDIKAINRILVYGGYVNVDEGGLMGPLYSLTVTVLFLLVIVNIRRISFIGGAKTALILSCGLFLFYIFTFYFIGQPYTPLVMFVMMTIVSMLLPSFLIIDTQLFLKATMLFPLLGIPNLLHIFEVDSVASWRGISMDVSYGFLISIISATTYVFGYVRYESIKERIVSYIGIIGNTYIFFYVLLYGSRAPILCIILAILFLYVFYYDKGHVSTNMVRLHIVIVSFIILLVSGFSAISLFNKYFQEIGIDIKALTKIISLAEDGDVSNGRSGLNSLTWNYIMDSPVWGYGIDRYDAMTSKMYPHNFLLQLLFDGGIILFLFVLIPIWTYLNKLWNKCTREQFYLIVMLFFSSVPGALFSQNMWQIIPLWVCFGAILHTNTVHRPVRRYKL